MTNQSPESVIAEALRHMVPSGDATMKRESQAYNIAAALRAANMLREPDAATAEIDRVRALHVPDEYGLCVECSWEYPETSYDALSNDVSWPCPTVAALEGAPEPEALELPETVLEVRDGDGDLITTGEHRRVLHQGGYVCDTCVNILGINVRWDRADRMEGHPLPAEGERK